MNIPVQPIAGQIPKRTRPKSMTPRPWCCRLMFVVWLSMTVVTVVKAQDAPNTLRVPREQFVPADQLESVFQTDQRGVLMSRAEFEKLLADANAAIEASGNQPLPVVVERAVIQVLPAERQALVTTTLTIRQFSDYWQTVRIPIGHLQLEKAETQDGRAAVVARDPGQPNTLLFAGNVPGVTTLTLTMSTVTAAIGNDRTAAFQLPQVASTTLNVTCPAGQHLLLNDRKLARPAAAGETAEYSVPIGAAQEVRLRWTDLERESESQTLVFVRTDGQLQVQREALSWSSDSRVSVFGGSINQITARVPSRLEITAVESSGLEGWVLEDDPDAAGITRVTLTFRQPFSQDRLIRISGVAPISGDTWQDVPTLEFVNVTSHAGQLLIRHESGLRLTSESGSGVRQITPDGLPPGLADASVFDFWQQQFELRVAVKPRDQELFSEVNTTLSISDSLVVVSAFVTVETLNAPLFELPVIIPPDWHLSSVTSPGVAVDWRTGTDPTRIVVIPATPIPQDGMLQLELQLQRNIPDPESEQRLAMPFVTPDQTTIVGGLYTIAFAADLSVSPVSVDGLAPVTGTGSRLVFRRLSSVVSGELSVVRKVPQLTSRSELRMWSDTRQHSVVAWVTIDVTFGTTREVTVELSEQLGADVRFDVVGTSPVPGGGSQPYTGHTGISEQTPLDPVEGMRPFVLKLHNRFAGSLALRAFVQQPSVGDQPLNAPVVRVRNAVRQHGLLVFEAYPEQELIPSNDVAQLDALSSADPGVVSPPESGTGRRIALTYRFVKPEYAFTVNRVQLGTETVPAAVCELMDTICLLNDSGRIQYWCRANFRTSGVQTLRFTLPPDTAPFLWSTLLNDEPVEVREDRGDYLVAVPPQSDNAALRLEILFDTVAVDPDAFGRLDQSPVRFAIDSGDLTSLPISVLQQEWTIRYPETTALVENDGPFRAVNGTDQPGWFRGLFTGELPSLEKVGERAVPIAFVAAVLFVVTALIHRRRWKTIAGLSAGGVLIFLLLLQAPMSERSRMIDSLGYNSAGGTEAPTSEAAFDEDAFQQILADADTGMGMMPPPAPSGPGGGPTTSSRDRREMARGGRVAMPPGAGGGMGGYGGGGFGAPGAEGAEVAATESPNAFGAYPGPLPGLAGSGITPATSAQPRAPEAAPGGPVQQNAQTATAGVPSTAAPQPESAAADVFDFDGATAGRKGSARLSVRVSLEPPADYRSRQFLSVGDTTGESGILTLVVQEQERITAMRMVSALVVLLLCWWMRSASVVTRLVVIVILIALAAAGIPLASNRWQSILDGVVIGALLGAGLLFASAIRAGLLGLGSVVRRCGAAISARRTAEASAVIALMLFVPAGMAQGPQRDADRPDVVVPYQPGNPPLDAAQVFVNHETFLRLYRAAHPEGLPSGDRNPLGNPVIAAFLEAGDFLPVPPSGSVLHIKSRFVIAVDSDHPVDVPVPIGPVALSTAALDGQPAVLQPVAVSPQAADVVAQQQQQQQSNVQHAAQQPNSGARIPAAAAYTVRVTGRGLHVLDVEFDIAAEVKGELGRIDLPLRPVASGSFRMTIPLDNADVRVNGRSVGFRRDGRLLILPIDTAGDTRIQWQPDTRRAAGDVVFHSEVTTGIAVTDSGIRFRSAITFQVRQGETTEAEIMLPAGYAIQSVTGADVAGWESEGADPARTLKLQFRRAVNDTTSVTLTCFRSEQVQDDRTLLEMPILQVRGATRDTGSVTLLIGDQFQVRSDALSGVSQINPDDAPVPEGDGLPGRRMLAWRYTRHPASASVRVSRTVEELLVNDIHAMRLEEQRQLWTSQFSVRISGAARSRIDVAIPAAFLVLDVAADGMTDWFITDGEEAGAGLKTLRIQLGTAREGTVNITLQGQQDRGTDKSVLTLTAPMVAGATKYFAQLAVWLDAASENAGVESGNWTIRPAAAIDNRFRELTERAADVAFHTQNLTPGDVIIRLRRAVPTMIAESVTVTTATDTSIELTLALNWQITRAATSSVSVEIPSSLAAALTFDVPDHRRTLREDTGAGRTRLTFELQQPVADRLFILGTGSFPLPDDGLLKPEAPLFVAAPADSATLPGQSHFWVIVNQSAGLFESTGDPQQDDVTTSQLTTSIPQEFLDQQVSIQRLHAGSAAWRLTFPVQHQVTPAIVTLASHTTVLADDGSWRSRHVLQVRNESRQFLPVKFPEGARLMYCLVGGRPSRVVLSGAENTDWHLIPIPQSGLTAAAFEIEFALAGQFSGAAAGIRRDWRRQRLEIPVPVFPEFRDNAELGISVSRNRWSVFVPESWQTELVEDPRLTNVEPAEETVLEDVSLRSTLEQATTLMSSVQSAKGKFIRGRAVQQLEQQRAMLGRISGNDPAVEAERQLLLGKLGEITQLYREESEELQQLREETSGKALGNFFLMEQDQNQNSYNFRNNALFLDDNRDKTATTPGDQIAPGNDAETQRFRFVLPAKPQSETRLPEEELRKNEQTKDAAPKELSEAMDEKKADGKTPARRSQLLQRQLSSESLTNPSQVPSRPDGANVIVGESRSDMLLGLQAGSALVQPDEMQLDALQRINEFGQQAGQGGGQQANGAALQSAPAVRAIETGRLSLDFEIPTDGYRLDFVRTGGNAQLTLDARASLAVTRGLGLLWAAACLVGIVLLLAAARRHSPLALARRLSLLASIALLVAWLILPSPVNSLGFVGWLAAAGFFCVSFLIDSLRKPVAG